jgi:hypothetical protein
MPEQKTNYMAQLDAWSIDSVINPLFSAAENYDGEHNYDWENTVEQVQKAIREKVLESYRNGQKAGPPRVFKPKGAR